VSELKVRETDLAGLYEVDLVVNVDDRGSFREVFQAEKLEKLGLPALGPVQWNISENNERGTLRGIHAEPWDKYVHMIAGEAFAAIVDLRPESPTFGRVCTFTLTQRNALFISGGLGNSYQVTSDGGTYGYLVNEHWSPDAKYTLVNYADPELAIAWPLDPGPTGVSEKDHGHPTLAELFPDAPRPGR
jgi:dTDP-4-dehydrorhamnose 3,5-epimerase